MFCKNCGTKFEGKFCPECGTPAAKNLESTSECNANAPDNAETANIHSGLSESMQPKQKKRIPKWGLIAICIFILMVIFCMMGIPTYSSMFVSLLAGTATYAVNIFINKKHQIPIKSMAVGTIICLALCLSAIQAFNDKTDKENSEVSQKVNASSEMVKSESQAKPEPVQRQSVSSQIETEGQPSLPSPSKENSQKAIKPQDNSESSENAAIETMGQKNALKAAKSYLSYTAFSYDGLVEQLEYSKFSHEDATYAADNCGANWEEQALKSAKSYLSYTAFSHKGLIEQLEFSGFTNEQAQFGADNCGADWNEEAVKSAKSYLKYTSFSRDSLIEQLEFSGFTHEQAVYGAQAAGY